MRHFLYTFATITLALGCYCFAYGSPRSGMRTRSNEHFEKGSYVSFAFGSGISRLHYAVAGDQATMLNLTSQNHFVFPSFSAAVSYRYYFLPWLGIRTGLDFSTFASRTDLGGEMSWGNVQTGQAPLYDYAGDSYEHHTAFRDWTEREDLYLIEVPLALSLKYKPRKIGVFSDLGVKLGIPVWSRYKQTKGDLVHSAYYPLYNLWIHDLPSRFETEPWRDNRSGTLDFLRTFNALAFAEFGLLFQLHPRLDLMLSLYASYTINSITENDKVVQELGFSSDFNGASAFMEPYVGLLNSTAAGAVHPWNAGVRLGLNIYCGRNKAQRKKQLQELSAEFPALMPHDTVYITLHDTIVISPVPTETANANQQLDRMLSETIIWFDFDKDIPKLQPANILDSIGTFLREHPELQISINGHTCSIGSERYNTKLGMRRALAVYRLLLQKGVRREQMSVASFGAHVPMRYNRNHRLSKDRRVEIVPAVNNCKQKCIF